MFTILEGSTFCICDDIGDVGDKASGLFAEDTRFLSCLKLRINGATPLPLSAGKVEYYSAASVAVRISPVRVMPGDLELGESAGGRAAQGAGPAATAASHRFRPRDGRCRPATCFVGP